MRYIFLAFFIILFFTACSSKYPAHNINENITNKERNNLTNLIIKTSANIDKGEAKDLSKNAIIHSMHLANKYKVTTTPLIHNTLINLNIKKRGFCYHYANDLKRHLKIKRYQSFKFIKIISNRNEYFEHTSIALTRNDIKFEDSIVLDPWRNAGKLYFSKIKDDKRYKWEKK